MLSMTDFGSVVSFIKATVRELQDDCDVSYDDLAEKLLHAVGQVPDTFISKPQAMLDEVEQCAIAIWNMAVAKKAGGVLSSLVNAKLRHAACCLVHVCNADIRNEGICKKLLLMSLKSARAWLDAGNPHMAEVPLDINDKCLEKLRLIVGCAMETNNETVDMESNERILDVERDTFQSICCRIDTTFHQERITDSLELVQKARRLLDKLPNEITFLSMLCYNFGVDSYQKKHVQNAIVWLKESFDIGKMINAVCSKNQARTLRLLATCHLDLDVAAHYDEALSAIDLANSEHSHPAGLGLKLRILLVGEGEDNCLKQALSSVIRHGDVTVNEALGAIQLVFQHGKHDIAYEGFMQIFARFQSSLDLWKVSVAQLDLLLRGRRLHMAQSLVEDVIVEQESGMMMDASGLNKIHLLLWEQATVCTEAQKHSEALGWYELSQRLGNTSSIGDSCLAKLHRNMTATYLHLEMLDKAAEELTIAERLESSSPVALFLRFKLSVFRNNHQDALDAMKQLDAATKTDNANTEAVQGLICMAAQLAHEKSKPQLAIPALESLVKHSVNLRQILTSLRCLVRLRFTAISDATTKSAEIEFICNYIETANSQLENLQKLPTDESEINVEMEALWFSKIAWNAALQCEESLDLMGRLFLLCFNLTARCSTDQASLGRQKTCLTMATATRLEIARTATDEAVQNMLLQETLHHIQQCRTVANQLNNFLAFDRGSGNGNDTTIPVLLLLYEFETKARLGNADLDKILDRAVALPYADAKVFEIMAALAIELSVKDGGRLCTKALKITISKYLQMNKPDFAKCSKAFHSLLELVLQRTSTNDNTSIQEIVTYFSEIIEIIETKAQNDYPQIEVLWLMTKAWNRGIRLFSNGKQSEGIQLCELSMRLLNQIGSLKSNYEHQMTSAYADLLSKISSSSALGS